MTKPPGPSIFLVGRIWHFRFRRKGVRVQRTTGTSARVRAEQIAWAEYCAEKMIPILRELVASWGQAHEMVVSDGHRRGVLSFGRLHLGGMGAIRIDRIRTEDVEDARNRYLKHHTQASANTWLRYLKLLFGWAVKRGLIDHVSWRVGRIRTQKKPRALLPAAKASRWLSAVDRITGKRWGLAAAIRMMVGAGLRESEALSARWEWIDFDRETYCPGKTKGREADPVSVPGWLMRFLEARRRTEGLIARSPRGGSYSKGSTREVILQANEESGTPGVSPHRLRGTYATLLSEEGTPIQDIKRTLRHKDIRTTEGYLETDMDRVREAQEGIARRMGFGRKKGEERTQDARP